MANNSTWKEHTSANANLVRIQSPDSYLDFDPAFEPDDFQNLTGTFLVKFAFMVKF